MNMGTEVVYEVNVEVDLDVADTYRVWLESHIQSILLIPGFRRAKVFIYPPESGSGRRGFCVQYLLTDRKRLEEYFAGPAQAMRAEAETRFGGKFRAWRRVLEPFRLA